MTKATDSLNETTAAGAFERTPSAFRNWISKQEGSKFPPEAGRYHLFISYACPWANRCLSALALKGLQDVIGVSVVHPTWQRTRPDDETDKHAGWVFRDPSDPPLKNTLGYGSFDGKFCIPNPINQAKSIRDLYEMSHDKHGKYSVPVLWDRTSSTIVNNESSEILRMFNSEFNDFANNPTLDLYPSDLIEGIEEANSWVYPCINNGVYKCGFAKTQEAYDVAEKELFEAMDRLENVLSRQRYLCGDRFTEGDLRAFMTLVRFDEVYVVYFKTNRKCVREYPNMLNYCREIYQMKGMQDTVNMKHIKTHYFTSHPTLNMYGIVPRGPDTLQDFLKPHNRDKTHPVQKSA